MEGLSKVVTHIVLFKNVFNSFHWQTLIVVSRYRHFEFGSMSLLFDVERFLLVELEVGKQKNYKSESHAEHY